MIPNLKDTIAAISTPQGHGAISIIRLSGSSAFEIADQVFYPSKKKEKKISHKLTHGKIVEDSKILDDVLISYMFEKKSYTAESLVEIHGHGGPLVVSEILNLLIKKGARLAEPGEFTFRAFMNGKLDLAQAESVFDVIYAKNKKALQKANENLRGDFSNEISAIRNKLLELLAHTEASIDFSTEDIDIFSDNDMLLKIKPIQKKIQAILNTYTCGKILMEGARIAIVGRPNVGKSSLLNAFLQKNRAIVTAEEGTTRDTVEEEINYKGLALKFIDTAGIRESKIEAEKIGIQKSKDKIKAADLVLLVLDASKPLYDQDRALLDFSQSKNRIVVLNKADLKMICEQRGTQVSALYSNGIEALLEQIYRNLIDENILNEETFLTKERHKIALENSLSFLNKFEKGIKEEVSLEFLALDLKSAVVELENVIGKIDMEDVYDKIFKSFCIGK